MRHTFARSIEQTPTLICRNDDQLRFVEIKPRQLPHLGYLAGDSITNHRTSVGAYGLYSLHSNAPSQVIIQDVLGRTVLNLTDDFRRSATSSSSVFRADLSTLSSGSYFVVFTSGSISLSEKIVKQ